MVFIPLTLCVIGFAASAFGNRFRVYSIVSLAAMIGLGLLTGLDAPRIGENLPTPHVGIWERVDYGVFLLWVVVLALALLRSQNENHKTTHA
jgi:hypothetical protein